MTTDTAERNPYLQLLEDEEAQRRQAMLGTVSGALDVNPDQYAARVRTARYLGYAPAVVAATPEASEREARLKQLEADTARAPVLQRHYTREDFARLASDDAGVLSKMEAGVGAMMRYVTGANYGGNTLAGDAAAGFTFDLSAASAQVFRAALETAAPVLDPLVDARILPANPLRGAAKEYAKIGGQAKATADRLSPPSDSIVQGGVSSGVRSLGTSVLGAATASVSAPAGVTAVILSALVGGEFRA